MPITAYYLSPDGQMKARLTPTETEAAFRSGEGLLWVDVADTTEEDGALLRDVFGFHPLAVEDCVSTDIRTPKIEEYEDHIFMIFHGIDHGAESELVTTTELDMFIGRNFVVSNHTRYLYSVESVRRRVEERGRPMGQGADFLAHALINALVDNIQPTMDQMRDVADELDTEVIERPMPGTLTTITKLRRSTLRIHRVMVHQREMAYQISRDDSPHLSEDARRYYRDIYDNIVRIDESNQILQERAEMLLAMYMSVISSKQNESMRVLSIVAVIFMPLTLLVGIYGMNFQYMPELGWRYGYFAVLGVCTTLAAGIVWWFWARRWTAIGRREVTRRVRPFYVAPERLVGYVERLAVGDRRPGAGPVE